MKKKINFLFLVTLVAGIMMSATAFAQQITVKGHVKDKTGEPIIGANVSVKGVAGGQITDLDGNFSIKADAKSTIVVSFIGYITKELPAKKELVVVLEEDQQMLEDVVVIGYGSVRKTDLSGSVIAIKAEEKNKGAVTSPQELIQGKVPGLFVAPGDGAPGSGGAIRIRGGASLNASNDPLIVIDGVPVSNDSAPGTPNALATINPNDIETFTVLKDASATAIYGSRASNGVIIITTKKGTQDKIKISYSGTFTAKDPYNRVKVLGAEEYRNIMLEQYPAGTNQGDNVRQYLNLFPEQTTDWQKEIFQTGLSTDQNISVAGKKGFLPFRASLGYNNERGTLLTSTYKRYTGAISLSPKFFDNHLSVDVNVKGTINKSRFADGGAVGAAAFFDPTKPVKNTDGKFNGYWNWTSGANPNTLSGVNPLSLLNDVDNHGTTKRSLGNIQLDYKIHGFEDLRVNLNLGYDVAESEGSSFVAPGSFQSAKDSDFTNIGQGSTWNNLRRNHLLDFYVNYVKEVSSIQSRFDVMAGYSWQHFYNSNFGQTFSNTVTDENKPAYWGKEKEGYIFDEERNAYLKKGSTVAPYENFLVSFFGRMNYSLMDRYLLTATLRRDGSSRFSSGDNRWGLFPSAALAWTISSEPWMKNTTDVLSNLKLRLGYGVTGQQEIGDYQYLTTYSLGTNPNGMYLGTFLLKPNGYSPDLKWEETTTYNLALDYGLLGNRIKGTFEYYIKHTKDLLNTVNAPAGTNFTNQIIANVGEMENKGFEFNIDAIVVDKKDFSWQLGYNITWNDSKITKLTAAYNPKYPGIDAGSAPFGTNTVIQKHQVDQLPGTFWLYKQVYDSNGKPIQNAIVDLNEDGQITEADRYFTGKSPMAKVFMGLSSQLNYKNWDLGFNLRSNLGNYVFNAFAADNSSRDSFGNQGFLNNLSESALTTGFKQRNRTEQKVTDYFLENASFLKMDNITLGYSFNKLFSKNISGRVSASIQNVFTITNYSGLDPEAPAIDYNVWPRPRTFTLGLNINF